MSECPRYLDPETLALARQMFEEALLALPIKEQTPERKISIASQILTLAATQREESAGREKDTGSVSSNLKTEI
jgi:hypothetical protein